MTRSKFLLTGFGPFLDVDVNPSGEIARALHGKNLGGAEVCTTILPVSYEHLGSSYSKAIEELKPEAPVALLSMGVHREGYFRLERRARPQLDSDKPDSEGRFARDFGPLGDRELQTTLDLEGLGQALRDGGAGEVRISENAGGYLCERCYYEVLTHAERLGVPGFFLHVPPLHFVAVDDQLAPVESMIAEIVGQTS